MPTVVRRILGYCNCAERYADWQRRCREAKQEAERRKVELERMEIQFPERESIEVQCHAADHHPPAVDETAAKAKKPAGRLFGAP